MSRQRGPLSEAADVYDLGLLMWQAVTALPLHVGWERALSQVTKSDHDLLLRLRPEVTESGAVEPEFLELMCLCWCTDPLRRPKVSTVHRLLTVC